MRDGIAMGKAVVDKIGKGKTHSYSGRIFFSEILLCCIALNWQVEELVMVKIWTKEYIHTGLNHHHFRHYMAAIMILTFIESINRP